MHKLFIFLLMFFIGDSAHQLISGEASGSAELYWEGSGWKEFVPVAIGEHSLPARGGCQR